VFCPSFLDEAKKEKKERKWEWTYSKDENFNRKREHIISHLWQQHHAWSIDVRDIIHRKNNNLYRRTGLSEKKKF
jgi:hypothetical protein